MVNIKLVSIESNSILQKKVVVTLPSVAEKRAQELLARQERDRLVKEQQEIALRLEKEQREKERIEREKALKLKAEQEEKKRKKEDAILAERVKLANSYDNVKVFIIICSFLSLLFGLFSLLHLADEKSFKYAFPLFIISLVLIIAGVVKKHSLDKWFDANRHYWDKRY